MSWHRVARIVAIVPAHNEEADIVATIASLVAQTLRPVAIIVAADNCTDSTVALAKGLDVDGLHIFETFRNSARKAGAMNAAIDLLGPTIGGYDAILTVDADSALDSRFCEYAAGLMGADPMLGGLSTTFVGRADVGTTKGERLLAALQRVEYAKARELRVGSHIHSMSGAGALYRVEAVEHVIADRGALFDERPSNLVEDFETTLTLKRLGWSVTAHSWCVCSTDVMTSVPELLAQRERWTRGTIDELRRHGLTSYTARTIANVVTGLLLSIWFLAYPAIIVAAAGVVSIAWIVPGLVIVPVFNAWAARSLGWRIIAVELAILPELVYHLLRTWWLAKSVVMSYSSRPQAW